MIKPSGVEYGELSPELLVVVDLEGNKVEGDLNPSSDTKTHLELYRVFPSIGGIVHSHSPYAVSPTHADYFLWPCAVRAPSDTVGDRREL